MSNRLDELEARIQTLEDTISRLDNLFTNVIPMIKKDAEYAAKSVIELAETLGRTEERVQKAVAIVEEIKEKNDKFFKGVQLGIS